jgi:hypothetical protein
LDVERRRAAVAEENAKIGWKKVELLAERNANQKLLKARVVPGEVVEADSDGGTAGEGKEQKILPLLGEVLAKDDLSAEEKLARVKEVIGLAGLKLLDAPTATRNPESGGA